MIREQRVRQSRQALQRRAEWRAGVEHEAFEQDGANAHESAGPIEQLLREHVRVARPEHVDRVARREGVGDQLGRCPDVGPLFAAEPVEQALRQREVAMPGVRGGGEGSVIAAARVQTWMRPR